MIQMAYASLGKIDIFSDKASRKHRGSYLGKHGSIFNRTGKLVRFFSLGSEFFFRRGKYWLTLYGLLEI